MCRADLHKVQEAFAMKCLFQILSDDIWVICISLGQEDKDGNFCMARAQVSDHSKHSAGCVQG